MGETRRPLHRQSRGCNQTRRYSSNHHGHTHSAPCTTGRSPDPPCYQSSERCSNRKPSFFNSHFLLFFISVFYKRKLEKQIKKIAEKYFLIWHNFCYASFGTTFAVPAILAAGRRNLPFWLATAITSADRIGWYNPHYRGRNRPPFLNPSIRVS